MASDITFFLIGVITFLFVSKFRFKPKHIYPPGPSVGIPFFGILPSYLGPKPYETFDRWSKEFGDIFRIKIAGKNCIVLNSFDVIREAYVLDGNGNNFLDRPLEYSVLGIPFGFRAFGFLNGAEWAVQQKLYISVIRKCGAKLEAWISASAMKLVSQIEEFISEPIDVHRILAETALNVISSLVCSQRLCEDDPETARLIMEDMALIYTLSPGDDGFLFGNAMKIYANYFSNKSRLMTEVRNRQHKLMKRFVEEHEAKFDPNNIRDYIDICLNEKIKAKSRAERKWFDVEAITANMFLFYTTGVDTSTITLQFGVYLLAKHPSVQERCFEELSSVVGDDVTVKYSDRSRLPYFSAVVNEIYRYSIVAPLPSSRQNSRWTRLEGYDIPAGTLTITNLWSATRDPKHWANGYEFDPNHFYDKYRSRDLSSIHFSLGKRACPGESLATLEFFIVLATIIQNFQISEVPDAPLMETILPGFVRSLAPFKVRFLKRKCV